MLPMINGIKCTPIKNLILADWPLGNLVIRFQNFEVHKLEVAKTLDDIQNDLGIMIVSDISENC